jgi:hypothetical protein
VCELLKLRVFALMKSGDILNISLYVCEHFMQLKRIPFSNPCVVTRSREKSAPKANALCIYVHDHFDIVDKSATKANAFCIYVRDHFALANTSFETFVSDACAKCRAEQLTHTMKKVHGFT